jgi:hypothetical protein
MARKNPPKATRSITLVGCPYTEEEIEGMAQRHEGHGAGLVHLEGMVRVEHLKLAGLLIRDADLDHLRPMTRGSLSARW